MRLILVVSCACLFFVTACSSDSSKGGDGSGGGSSTSGECATSPGDLAFMAKLAEEIGNGCSYAVFVDGSEVANGTCNLGGVVQDLKAANGGGTQFTMQGQIEKGADDSGLFKRFEISGMLAGSWADKAGTTFAPSVEYLQAPEMPSSGNAIGLLSEPNFLYADCSPSSSSGGTFMGMIDTVREVCNFGTQKQFEVHGALEVTCEGSAGSSISSTQHPMVTISATY